MFLLAMGFSIAGMGQSTLPAVIDQNTVLTVEGSPYQIEQNLTISSGITLKINAGVRVHIANGASISNAGNLLIEGSASDSVLFTSDSPETRWNYIANQGTFIAKYLMIRRATRFVTSYGDTVIIEHCDVADTYRGVGDDVIGVHDAQKLIIRNSRLTCNSFRSS